MTAMYVGDVWLWCLMTMFGDDDAAYDDDVSLRCRILWCLMNADLWLWCIIVMYVDSV